MMKAYLVYSLEYTPLAREEVKALIEVEAPESRLIAEAEGVILLEAEADSIEKMISRSAYILEYGEVLSYGSILEAESIVEEAAGIIGSRMLSVKSIKGYGEELLSKIVAKMSKPGGRPLRVLVSEGLVVAGIERWKLKPSRVIKPRAKSVTGALDPRISRAYVNLSRLRRGGVFLDPFCGTGNLAIEACAIGASKSICIDIDKDMCRAAVENTRHLGLSECISVVRGDARDSPLADRIVDAVAADPPYGRSSSTRGDKYENLVERFLAESVRVIRGPSYIVYAGPYESKPWSLAEKLGLTVVKRIHMFVHRSLIREIVVARAE